MDKKASSKKKSRNKSKEKFQIEAQKANAELGLELSPEHKRRESGIK